MGVLRFGVVLVVALGLFCFVVVWGLVVWIVLLGFVFLWFLFVCGFGVLVCRFVGSWDVVFV